MNISNILGFQSPQSLFYDHLEGLDAIKNNPHSILPVSFKAILWYSVLSHFLPSILGILTFECLSKVNLKLYYILLPICHLCISEFSVPTAWNIFPLPPVIKCPHPSQRNNTTSPLDIFLSTFHELLISVIYFYACSSPHPAAVVQILFIFSAHLFLNVYRMVCVFMYITKPHRYKVSG